MPVFQKSVPMGKYTMIVQEECSSNVVDVSGLGVRYLQQVVGATTDGSN